MAHPIQVTFDCADPDRLATFWASALGYKKQDPPDGFETWNEFLASIGVPEDRWNSASAVVDPDGAGPRIYFQRVPEAKIVKNRVHVDVNVGTRAPSPEEARRLVDREVDRLVAEGATNLRRDEEHGEYWAVMQDPEGNEFCIQ
jgi:hypothetical protein